MMQAEMLTTKQISEEAEIPLRTVQHWIQVGKLPGQKFGRDWFVSRADWEEFRDNLEQTNEQQD